MIFFTKAVDGDISLGIPITRTGARGLKARSQQADEVVTEGWDLMVTSLSIT